MMTTALPSTALPTRASVARPRLVARLAALDLILLRREVGVMVALIGFPAVTLLVIAGVFGSTPDPEFGGVAPSEHYVVGYVGVVLAALGLITLPSHLAAQRELGVRRRYRAAGLDGSTLVASHVVLGIVLGVLAGGVVLTVGALVYGVPMPADPLAAAGWFALGLVCFIAIGTALGAVLPSSRAAAGIGNLLFVPMFLLGGGGPPRDVMTGVMRSISDALPLTHVIGGMRAAWLGRTDDPSVWWWPLLVAALAVAVAVWAQRRQER